MRIWFPAAPDATISNLDRALLGLGISIAVDEPAIPIGPVLLTVRGSVAAQALTVRGAGSSQALSTYTRPSSTVLTVRDEVIT